MYRVFRCVLVHEHFASNAVASGSGADVYLCVITIIVVRYMFHGWPFRAGIAPPYFIYSSYHAQTIAFCAGAEMVNPVTEDRPGVTFTQVPAVMTYTSMEAVEYAG